ncbi:dipicolinate synthase subunit DpsA [Saccharopolyspora pogona]|uniref:dipicolinate synthase subunit DpsA n=1 Tax=Saccharopolyspora pogona TaxID=333966 RepID=UPI00168259BB|nr:dipicolinate synthase subunit DpsA [Saccharopolyspora pogona]
MDLSHRIIAIVGGDEREQEIARCAVETGAQVRGYGFPWPASDIAGVRRTATAADALLDADYALFPIPGLSPDGALFAPACSAPIYPDVPLLQGMRPNATIILGWADEKLSTAAENCGIALSEYESDTELMLLRGPAIVEGALQAAIENTEITLHNARIGVIGHGNIGRLLARTLVLLGGRVQVFARNPVQRADAASAGADSHPLEDLDERIGQLDMVFSTVPTRVLTGDLLERMRPGLVMDLAAPPGGIDLEAAERLGHSAVWARGLGRRAPVTVGRSQWSGIVRRIAEAEEQRNES